MASSTFIERSPDRDKTLVLVMDDDNNLTGHPAYIDKMLSSRQPHELRVVRLRASLADSDTDSAGEDNNVPKVNLTVEEILPEVAGEEGRSADSTLPPDMVDPLSQLDNEQMLRLKKALASEQAKQILGENVTAMLDMLSVDETSTAFLQQCIKNDHCYTNLSPSADPKGPSFLTYRDSTPATTITLPRPRGRPPASASAKAALQKKAPVPSTSASNAASDNEDTAQSDNDYECSDEETESEEDGDRDSDEDYRDRSTPRSIRRRGGLRGGRRGGRGGLRIRGGTIRSRGRVRVLTSETPVESPSEKSPIVSEPVVVQSVSPAAIVQDVPNIHSASKRGRPRKMDSSSVTFVKSTAPSPADVTPVDIVAAKVISGDAIRLGRPIVQKTEEERRREMARVLQSLEGDRPKTTFIVKKIRKNSDEKQMSVKTVTTVKASEIQQVLEALHANTGAESDTNNMNSKNVVSVVAPSAPVSAKEEIPTVNKSIKLKTYEKRDSGVKDAEKLGGTKMMGNKYPRRENRKLPAHLADTELFSTPDVIKRLSSADEAAGKSKVKVVQKSMLTYMKKPEESTSAVSTPATEVAPTVTESNPPPPESDIVSTINEKETKNVEEVKEPEAPKHTEQPQQTEEQKKAEEKSVEEDSVIASELQNMMEGPSEVKQVINEPLPEPPPSSPLQKETPVKPEPVSSRRTSSGKSKKTPAKEEKMEVKTSARRRSSSSAKQDETIEDVIAKTEKEEKEEALDELQMNASLLQPLPPESMNQLIQSVVEDEEKEELKKEEGKEEVKKARRGRQPSKDGKAGSSPVSSTSSLLQNDVSSSPPADDKKRHAVKRNLPPVVEGKRRRRSDEVSEVEDSDLDETMSEASWNSEDDPERLWCICRKPHDNRFMICCDKCQDWFHGQCVGISKTLGKQMEADGLEWSCPKCTKKKRLEDKEKEMNKVPSNKMVPPGKAGDLKQTKLTNLVKRASTEENTPRKCIMCKGPVRENSVYCSDECIRKHSQRAIAQLNAKPEAAPTASPKPNPSMEQRIIVMDPTSKKILTGTSAPTPATLATFLRENPTFHVLYQRKVPIESTTKIVKVVQDGVVKRMVIPSGANKLKQGQMKLTMSPNSKQMKMVSSTQSVIKVIPAGAAPGSAVQKKLLVVSKQSTSGTAGESPKAKVGEQKFKIADVKKTDVKTPQRKRKEKHQVLPAPFKMSTMPAAKIDEKKGEQIIRESVKKTLSEALKARAQECKDLKVTDEEVESLVTKIEDRLFKHFEEKVDSKYKSKYRSLVFNIKDTKNETLYRKILENAISPKNLVKLSADEMASQELAQWREKEQQHQLEMIKKTELELMTQGQTFIMKSHKGEEVIGKEQKTATVVAEIDPNTPAQELVSALNSVSSTTPDTVEDDDKQRNGETSLMKMKKREKERRRERERDRDKDRRRGKDRKRSRSRDRSRHSKSSRKRSRSRSRSRHRHRDRKESTRENVKEKPQVVSSDTTEVPSTSESLPTPIEIKTPDDSTVDADSEPTSTVTIKTPETYKDEPDEETTKSDVVWSGNIIMADVAKFFGTALSAVGNCDNLKTDVGAKISVVGRISYDTVWDYLERMKKMATKDILVLQILPGDNEDDPSSFITLWSYLFKRSRIGVVKRTGEAFKDFYLYPHSSANPLPTILQPLNIPVTSDSGKTLLGIIVKTRKGPRLAAAKTTASVVATPPMPPSPSERSILAGRQKHPPLPVSPPSTSRSPLTEITGKKDPRLKKKVRVHVEVKPLVEDDDSPYSPASSDEDLPPLSKVPKVSASLTDVAPLSSVPLSDAAQIQKQIEEMNRAIEEQTQQIQSLASTVPLLPSLKDLTLPLMEGKQAILSVPNSPSPLNLPDMSIPPPPFRKHGELSSEQADPNSIPLPGLEPVDSAAAAATTTSASQLDISAVLPAVQTLVVATASALAEARSVTPVPGEGETILPASTKEADEPYSPTSSLSPQPVSPPHTAHQSIALPSGVDQISIPSNLQEILASIKQKEPSGSESPEPLPPGVEAEDSVALPPLTKAQPKKSKPQESSSVFENEGLPSFGPGKFKTKGFKFDVKLKTKDLDDILPPPGSKDIDERQPISVISNRSEDIIPVGSKDRDERIAPSSNRRDRDDRFDRGRGRDRSRDRYRDRERDRDDRYSNRKRRPRDPIEDEWEGSIHQFEANMRRRKREIHEKEVERLRSWSDSD